MRKHFRSAGIGFKLNDEPRHPKIVPLYDNDVLVGLGFEVGDLLRKLYY
jgi:hypothetical protein